MAGALTFAAPAWAPVVLVALALAAAALVHGYARAPVGGRTRVAALVLKLAGLALIAVCLLEPSRTSARARPGANAFVVLVDNSRGLTLRDRGAAGSRGDALRAALGSPAAPAPWLAKLGDTYQVRRYLFDDRLRRSADFSELAFDGRASDLGAALRGIADRFRGGPLAGILVLSDGNATDLDGTAFDAAGLPPVYAVTIGGDAPEADVAVSSVAVTQTAFEDAPVTIDARIDAAGQRGRTVVAELVDAAGKTVQRQELRVSSEDEALPARFRLRPERTGVSFYTVRVSAGAGAREATTANNARLVVVDRPPGPQRILYVGGRPGWDFKFLNRALADDGELQLVGLVRVAHREPKMVFHPKNDGTNPLFRGFGASEDDAESYDQPVLIRLGTRDATELAGGFPKIDEDLFAYHALVLDDLEAAFFTADQQAMIRRFVAERGGGLLMLGGQGSFGQGRYDRSPIAEVLPVYLDGAPVTSPPPVQVALTREGWLEPWTRLRASEGDERTRLAALAPLRVLSRVRGAKPGATVLAEATAAGGPHPALVVHRAGAGRSAALTPGDVWRWGLKDPAQQPDLAKFWRQTMRWLVADVPAAVAVRVERRAGEPGNTVTLRTRVRDRAFRPAPDATVRLEVTAPDGSRTELMAEPAAAEPGLYEAAFAARRSGGHRVRARAAAADGTAIGDVEAGWAVDLDADEHRSIRANPALLDAVARQTGGQSVRSADLETFVRELPGRRAPVADFETHPLWHSWMVFAAAVACFLGEWALRRRRGLA